MKLEGSKYNSWLFVRTCQSCGYTQTDIEPKGEPTLAFENRKYKKCKSESLDYGSFQLTDPREIEDSKNYEPRTWIS